MYKAGERKIAYIDYPAELPLAAYEFAQKCYVDQVAALPDVISVYRMGGFSSPGISDLDFIVVLDEPVSSTGFQLDVSSINKISSVRKVFRHGPMVMPRDVFQNLPWLFDASDLTLLHGENLPTEDIREDLRLLRDISLAIEFLPRLLHRFNRTVASGVVPIRESLASLYSAMYFLKLDAEVVKLLPSDYADYLEQVVYFRSDWRSSMEQLPNLIASVMRSLFVFSAALAEKYLDSWMSFPIPPHLYLHQGYWEWACFAAEQDSGLSATTISWFFPPFDFWESFIRLPSGFLRYYLYCADYFPDYHRRLRKHLAQPVEESVQRVPHSHTYSAYMEKRMGSIKAQSAFLQSSNFEFGRIADLGLINFDHSLLLRPGRRPKIEWMINSMVRIYWSIGKSKMNVI